MVEIQTLQFMIGSLTTDCRLFCTFYVEFNDLISTNCRLGFKRQKASVRIRLDVEKMNEKGKMSPQSDFNRTTSNHSNRLKFRLKSRAAALVNRNGVGVGGFYTVGATAGSLIFDAKSLARSRALGSFATG
jgi:hypothetical protein